MNRVRAVRVEQMLTQRELAGRAALSERTIRNVEAGFSCSVVTRRKILRALWVPPGQEARVFPGQSGKAPE